MELDNKATWKGDVRQKLIHLFEPLVEGTDYHFEINTGDTTKKILDLFVSDQKSRIMGIEQRTSGKPCVFFNSDFYDYLRKEISLPDNERPKKKQPHVKIPVETVWNVMCVATGKRDYMSVENGYLESL